MTVATQIETARLILRAPEMSDARELIAAAQESLAELKPWLPWAQNGYEIEDARRFLVGAHDECEMEIGYSFLIFQKSGELVGACSLQNLEPSVPRVEIGYWQRSGACGNGFMSEAVRALADEAFENLGVFRVQINCDPRNEKSANVARRAGFELEAHLKNDRRDHFGVLSDTLVFARTNPEG